MTYFNHALHIIFMVSYFWEFFYLTARIFVYYKDTDAFESPKGEFLREQYVFIAEDYGILSRFSVCFDDDFWNNFNFNEPYTFTNVLVSVENSLSHRTFSFTIIGLGKKY